MKVLFDTSVLVPAFADQLANHEPAFECFRKESVLHERAVCSCHALAETYATLTALPLPRRISAAEAARLVGANFSRHLKLVSLVTEDYSTALQMTSERGLVSGQIYDALHVVAAIKSGCSRIYTYNLRHFRALAPSDMEICAP